MKGSGSHTYGGAWEFFKKRELAGVKIPTKKAKPTETAPSSSSTQAPAADPFSIELDGMYTDSVEVYDSCDEIRRKITVHLLKPGVTKAQFCRDLKAMLYSPSAPARIQSNQLDQFRGYKGAGHGNTSVVYYTAYVYFERLRIAEGKPKTKHRLGMEDAWPCGAERERNNRGRK
jgi:hypothetical protein